MKKFQLFTIYCLLFILGVLIANFLKFNFFDVFYLFISLLLCLVLSIIFWHHKKISLIALAMAFLLLGIWRFGINQPQIDQNHIAYYNNQQIEFVGQVVDEPDIRDKHRKLTIAKIKLDSVPLRGKFLINAPNYPLINYGDWLRVNCLIEQPGMIKDFDYRKFLAVKGIYSVCYRANKVQPVEARHNLSLDQKFRSQIIKLKFKYKKIIDKSVTYPDSEILSAMLLGLRRGIPEKITDNFRRSGLSHIIAISGLHISIVSLLLLNMFIAIGFKRKYAFPLAIVSLVFFLFLIGFRPSSVRAGIMGFVALLALQSGRLNKSVNALLLAGSILLLFNPKLLLNDVGFQLSFLAVLGIIYLGGYVNKILTKLKVPESFEIRSSLMMTISAQLTVLPLIVYYFGNLSIISPLANVLVLPVLPFVMIAGFILGIAGFIFLPVAGLVGHITNILVNWIILVAEKLTLLPGANFELKKINFIWILIIYMLISWKIWLVQSGAIYRTKKRQ